MTLSYEDATRQVTAPGQRFETTELTIGGVSYTVFRHAPTSLRDLFATARRRGDTTFLVYEDERWSFAQVMEQVDALGATLVERYGVQPGDRVAISMRNYPEWIMSFAAIISIGAISVSMNAWWTEDELDYTLEDCGARVLIADVERARLSRSSADRLGFRTIVVRGGDEVLADVDHWNAVVEVGAALPEVDIAPDDDATILYTSGTTGRPKGAVSTHRSILQSLLGFGCRSAIERLRRPEEQLAAGANPVFILIVPLFHVTGCVPVMLSCFASGLKLVIMYRWEPHRALELIEREAGHQLRGRADPELGPARVAELRRLRHVEPGERRRRRSARSTASS